jgi:uncharacterized RDD family membrane protein YckC
MERMTANGKQLDTSVEIVTPENIAFRYRVAGPFRRLPAYLIDLAIRVAVVVVTMIGLQIAFSLFSLGGMAMGISLVIWFLLEWFYGGVFETYWNGQTPGKRAMNIRVVSIDGQPIHGWQAILRNVLRVVDAQPFWLYQVGLLAASMNDRYQRVGDLACGTMVVVDQRQRLQGVVELREPRVAEMASRIPPNFQVDRTLGRALTAYVQRRKAFSHARRLEIAGHLGRPLMEKLGMPRTTDADLLLCGLYQRTFLGTDSSVPPPSGRGPG